MKSKILDKKAIIPFGEFIGFLVFVVVMFVLILVLNGINKSKEKKIMDDITLQKAINEAHNNIISFLKQQNNDSNMQETIINSYYNNDYTQVTQNIISFFNSKYSGDWALIIKDSSNKNILTVNPHNILGPGYTGLAIIRKNVATAYIPLNPSIQSGYLEITLWQMMGQEVINKAAY